MMGPIKTQGSSIKGQTPSVYSKGAFDSDDKTFKYK